MGTSVAFRLTRPDRYSWRHWDGELVFLDIESGETRLVSGWFGAVLDFIAVEQPVGLEAICLGLAEAAGLPNDEDFHERVQEAVDRLRSFGMIGDGNL